MTDLGEVATAVGSLRQGSICRLSFLPLMSAGDGPLHPAAQEYFAERPDSRGLVVLATRVETQSVMVLTQTCDLQASKTQSGKKVLIQVAPVVTLDGGELRDALRDTRPNYVHAPWSGDHDFADLDQIASVDRCLFAAPQVLADPSEDQRRPLAYRLGRYFSRAALPGEVYDSLRPLTKLADARNANLLRVRDAVHEIRVASDPGYDDAPPWILTVTLVISPEWYPDVEPTTFSNTSNHIDIASQLVRLHDRFQEAEFGAIPILWRRLLDYFEGKIRGGLESASKGRIENVFLNATTSLTSVEIARSDVLDLGHLSLD